MWSLLVRMGTKSPLPQRRFDQGRNLRAIGTCADPGTDRLHHLTHGFWTGHPDCGCGGNFVVDDRSKLLLVHSCREVSLDDGQFGQFGRLRLGAAGPLIYGCSFSAFLRLDLEHGNDLVVAQGYRLVPCDRRSFHGGDCQTQGRFSHLVAGLDCRGEIVLQALEQR